MRKSLLFFLLLSSCEKSPVIDYFAQVLEKIAGKDGIQQRAEAEDFLKFVNMPRRLYEGELLEIIRPEQWESGFKGYILQTRRQHIPPLIFEQDGGIKYKIIPRLSAYLTAFLDLCQEALSRTNTQRPIFFDSFFKNFLKFLRFALSAYINTLINPEIAPNIVTFFLDPLTNWIGLDPFLNQPFFTIGSM